MEKDLSLNAFSKIDKKSDILLSNHLIKSL